MKKKVHLRSVSLSYRAMVRGETVWFSFCAFVDKYFAVVDV